MSWSMDWIYWNGFKSLWTLVHFVNIFCAGFNLENSKGKRSSGQLLNFSHFGCHQWRFQCMASDKYWLTQAKYDQYKWGKGRCQWPYPEFKLCNSVTCAVCKVRLRQVRSGHGECTLHWTVCYTVKLRHWWACVQHTALCKQDTRRRIPPNPPQQLR